MKLDRLLGILTVLLQRDSVTAPYLAEKFEVSRRTISRDIDALCRAGIPVVTRPGGGGGISIAEGYRLDKSVLTTDELMDITAALKGLGTVHSRMERTLDKLTAGKGAVLSLRENIVIDLSSYYGDSLSQKISLIKRAIAEQRVIEFDYYSGKGKTRRNIEPCLIVFEWGAWYVFGYCSHRQDFRFFKLGRLWDLSVGTGRFTPRDIPAGRLDPHACHPDPYRVVALFDAEAEYQLIETYGFSSFTKTPEGKLRFEAGYTNRDYMMTWLLGFGDRVRVLEPADMACDIKAIARNMINQYE